jgi:hypothetical protein
MSDPIPGCDPSEAYEVVPLDPIRKDRDPEYRASLITNKLWETHAGR